jgi:hypothetical protein
MKHNIIKTENYLLIVDDSEIKEGDWIYESDSNSVNIVGKGYHNFTQSDAKITAHLPLNNSPVLEGVPLLPPLEDDDEEVWEQGLGAELEKLLPYMKHLDDGQYNSGQLVGFEIGATWGYNKTKEKYKYTEKDMINAILFGMQKGLNVGKVDETDGDWVNNYVKSPQQPKMPVAFECEESVDSDSMYVDYVIYKPKTTTNPQGQTKWVGKYIY